MKEDESCPRCGSRNGLRLCLRCGTAHLYNLFSSRGHEPEFCPVAFHDRPEVKAKADWHLKSLKKWEK